MDMGKNKKKNLIEKEPQFLLPHRTNTRFTFFKIEQTNSKVAKENQEYRERSLLP